MFHLLPPCRGHCPQGYIAHWPALFILHPSCWVEVLLSQGSQSVASILHPSSGGQLPHSPGSGSITSSPTDSCATTLSSGMLSVDSGSGRRDRASALALCLPDWCSIFNAIPQWASLPEGCGVLSNDFNA